MTTLILDNHDSFTGNLVHLVHTTCGEAPVVAANDEITWDQILNLNPDRVIISPGPGRPDRPKDFGICARVVQELNIRTLGVCLGHQGIACSYGARIVRGTDVRHGRVSEIFHDGDSLFHGIPSPFQAVRYHSLIATELPDSIKPIAWTADGILMGIRHRSKPQWGVQFHPESILTEYGGTIIRNFLGCDQLHVAPPPVTTRDTSPLKPSLLTARRLSTAASPTQLFRTLFADAENSFWFDSSLTDGSAGRFSYMGVSKNITRRMPELAHRVTQTSNCVPFAFQGGWVGYVAYEGECRFGFVDRFLAIDHQTGENWLVFCAPNGAEAWFNEMELRQSRPPLDSPCQIHPGPHLTFDTSEAEYNSKIRECQSLILEGETYEICLTTKLRGLTSVDPLSYYEALRRVNPAPYAAWLNFPDLQIACASPELFLEVDGQGFAKTKPIKGTSPRGIADFDDIRLRELLACDEKNRAENLMIVDLARNDLATVCEPGSVEVTKLMDVESFATVHQLVSTIQGRLKSGASAIDCLRAAFPPGSMTGAPKIRTMQIIKRLEPEPRGIYSGCLGYLSLDGSAMFNVVIRTAVFQEGAVTIGTGGAIVAQSDPADEWRELELKTDAMRAAFGACNPGTNDPSVLLKTKESPATPLG